MKTVLILQSFKNLKGTFIFFSSTPMALDSDRAVQYFCNLSSFYCRANRLYQCYNKHLLQYGSWTILPSFLPHIFQSVHLDFKFSLHSKKQNRHVHYHIQTGWQIQLGLQIFQICWVMKKGEQMQTGQQIFGRMIEMGQEFDE